MRAGPQSATGRVGRWPLHRRRSLWSPAVLALGLGFAGLLLVPLVAIASAPTQATITGTISPAVNNAGVTPISAGLSILARFQTNPPGGQPAAVTQAVISFSHGSTVNSALFPSCSPGRLNAIGTGACPPGSRIGGGSTEAVGAGVLELLKVTAFNGPHGRSVLFYLSGNTPIRVAQAINAPLVRLNSLFYAFKLTLTVPQDLRVIAGVPVSVTQFQTTVRATIAQRVHGRTVHRGYIEVPLCPAGALVPLRGVFTFTGTPTQTVNSGIACGQPPP
jgi:hypothetical protein